MPIPSPTEKQAKILWTSVTGLSLGILIVLIGLLAWGVGWLIHLLAPVLWPLAIAGVIAYLLDPMVDFLERRSVPRARAILLVFIICLAVVAAVLAQIIPRLAFETKRLVDDIPAYSKEVQKDVAEWMGRTPFLVQWKDRLFPRGDTNAVETAQTNAIGQAATPADPGATNAVQEAGSRAGKPVMPDDATANKIIQAVLKWLASILPTVGEWLLSQFKKVASWAGMVIGLALVPVFTFYFLLQKQAISRTWTNYLPVRESRFKEEAVFVISSINEYLITFFRGQVVVAMCIGVLLTIGFLLMGLNYAVLLGLMAGVLSIIPYLGAILTILPAVALAAVQFKDWWHPVLVVAIFAAVQSLEGLVISPKIMGDRVGLHPMTIIIAVLVGSILLGGILGGVLAIPLTAALRVIMFRYVWKAPDKK